MSWELESPPEADGFAVWLTDPEREGGRDAGKRRRERDRDRER